MNNDDYLDYLDDYLAQYNVLLRPSSNLCAGYPRIRKGHELMCT